MNVSIALVVRDVDYVRSFGYLAFHTPFGGMVKGAHRTMMRKMARAKPAEIEEDFTRRVSPGLVYCQRVGNITLSIAEYDHLIRGNSQLRFGTRDVEVREAGLPAAKPVREGERRLKLRAVANFHREYEWTP